MGLKILEFIYSILIKLVEFIENVLVFLIRPLAENFYTTMLFFIVILGSLCLLFLIMLIFNKTEHNLMPQGKLYKVNYFKTLLTYGCLFMFIAPFFIVYLYIKDPPPETKEMLLVLGKEMLLVLGFVFSMFWTFALIIFYFLNMKVVVNETGIYVKKIDKLESAQWDEIVKVQIKYEGRVILRKKRGSVEFFTYLENYREILDEIGKMTGKFA